MKNKTNEKNITSGGSSNQINSTSITPIELDSPPRQQGNNNLSKPLSSEIEAFLTSKSKAILHHMLQQDMENFLSRQKPHIASNSITHTTLSNENNIIQPNISSPEAIKTLSLTSASQGVENIISDSNLIYLSDNNNTQSIFSQETISFHSEKYTRVLGYVYFDFNNPFKKIFNYYPKIVDYIPGASQDLPQDQDRAILKEKYALKEDEIFLIKVHSTNKKISELFVSVNALERTSKKSIRVLDFKKNFFLGNALREIPHPSGRGNYLQTTVVLRSTELQDEDFVCLDFICINKQDQQKEKFHLILSELPSDKNVSIIETRFRILGLISMDGSSIKKISDINIDKCEYYTEVPGKPLEKYSIHSFEGAACLWVNNEMSGAAPSALPWDILKTFKARVQQSQAISHNSLNLSPVEEVVSNPDLTCLSDLVYRPLILKDSQGKEFHLILCQGSCDFSSGEFIKCEKEQYRIVGMISTDATVMKKIADINLNEYQYLPSGFGYSLQIYKISPGKQKYLTIDQKQLNPRLYPDTGADELLTFRKQVQQINTIRRCLQPDSSTQINFSPNQAITNQAIRGNIISDSNLIYLASKTKYQFIFYERSTDIAGKPYAQLLGCSYYNPKRFSKEEISYFPETSIQGAQIQPFSTITSLKEHLSTSYGLVENELKQTITSVGDKRIRKIFVSTEALNREIARTVLDFKKNFFWNTSFVFKGNPTNFNELNSLRSTELQKTDHVYMTLICQDKQDPKKEFYFILCDLFGSGNVLSQVPLLENNCVPSGVFLCRILGIISTDLTTIKEIDCVDLSRYTYLIRYTNDTLKRYEFIPKLPQKPKYLMMHDVLGVLSTPFLPLSTSMECFRQCQKRQQHLAMMRGCYFPPINFSSNQQFFQSNPGITLFSYFQKNQNQIQTHQQNITPMISSMHNSPSTHGNTSDITSEYLNFSDLLFGETAYLLKSKSTHNLSANQLTIPPEEKEKKKENNEQLPSVSNQHGLFAQKTLKPKSTELNNAQEEPNSAQKKKKDEPGKIRRILTRKRRKTAGFPLPHN